MGLAIPRPAMRNGERKRIEASLRRHYELMVKYEAEGLSRDEASRKAYDEITTKKEARG